MKPIKELVLDSVCAGEKPLDIAKMFKVTRGTAYNIKQHSMTT